ncbi:MAG TPA: hypothetical protein VFA58_07435, partial [Chthoniobacterales bacterium]|nr:hypothetical protein [Chthoniobacterales bacterium]
MKAGITAALGAWLVLIATAHADISRELAEASKPLSEGIPEVAAFRLHGLLKQPLSEADWRAVAEKLVEALAGTNQTKEALALLADPRLRASLVAKFWRAQLLAGIHQEAEALLLYREVAADERSDLRSEAL